MKTIGNKIKELRRSKGMSQKDIADKLNNFESSKKQLKKKKSLPLYFWWVLEGK